MTNYEKEREKMKIFSQKNPEYSSYVTKCILCGDKASEFGGHAHFEDSESFLIAGFCSDCSKEKETLNIQTESLKRCHIKNGCFGNINNDGLIKYKDAIINFKY
jgi:hypothetical protein